jgi:HPt (histidine-containing phosphotransfer) domain-containing protein
MTELPYAGFGFPESPALDLHVLEEIEILGDAVGSDLVGELAVMFLDDARLRVVELRSALTDHDAEALVRSAHNLKGASATVGATSLARLCASLESSRGDFPLPLSFKLLQDIEREVERVDAAFDSRVRIVD